jgi:hypothetical protein
MDLWLAWWMAAGIHSLFYGVYLKTYQKLIRKHAKEYLAKQKPEIAQEATEDSDMENKKYINLNENANNIN